MRIPTPEEVRRFCVWAHCQCYGMPVRIGLGLGDGTWFDGRGPLPFSEALIVAGLEHMRGGCSGPLADEGGGRMVPGDLDLDHGDSHACPWPSDCPARCRYRDCDGADDTPNDNLEA